MQGITKKEDCQIQKDIRPEHLRYREEREHWENYLSTSTHQDNATAWSREDTVNAWRHQRMYACLDPVLEAFPTSEWITVGDGRYGKDAHYIQQKGHKVIATDISDALLRVGHEQGYIDAYRAENAESLSFGDESTDFVFCKEAYHHFPRPTIALYEMLRVARTGVVLIEPHDYPMIPGLGFVVKRLLKWGLLRTPLRHKLRSKDTALIEYGKHSWEPVGNYLYRLSRHELERVAIGVGCEYIAFKGLNDWYVKGGETEVADEKSPLFKEVQKKISEADRQCERGLSLCDYGYLVVIIFKQPLSAVCIALLEAAGYVVSKLPHNPNSR